MENEEKIVIYKNKIKFNIVSIVLIILAILMSIFQLDMIKGLYSYEIDAEVIVNTVYTFILVLCFLGIGLYFQVKENKKSKNISDIKENGRIFKGEVISIIRERHIRHSDTGGDYRYTTEFIIKFRDINMEDKYIITPVLPHKFDAIEVFKKTLNIEDLINLQIKEYFGDGYITFNENDSVPNLASKFYKIHLNGKNLNSDKCGKSYNGSIIKNNYKGNITCNVYEKDGRYVIDDYEGVEFTVEKNNWFDWLMILVFIVVSIVGIYFSMKK